MTIYNGANVIEYLGNWPVLFVMSWLVTVTVIP